MRTRTLVIPFAFAGSTLFTIAPESATAAVSPPVASHHNALVAELDTVVGSVVAMKPTGPALTQPGSSALCHARTHASRQKPNLIKGQVATSATCSKLKNKNVKLTPSLSTQRKV